MIKKVLSMRTGHYLSKSNRKGKNKKLQIMRTGWRVDD